MPKCLKSYKDKEKAKAYVYRNRKRYYHKTAFIYEKRRWTTEEDKLVLTSKLTDTQLSEKIQRSVQAIQLRRLRLKREYQGE